MALMNILIIPMGSASTSVGDFVADIERFLRKKKIDHSLGDMGTVVYGEVDELCRLAAEMHNIPFTKGIERVITQITIDDRRDKQCGIGDKEQAVMTRLQQS